MFEAARSFHISSRSAIMYVVWRNNYSLRSEIIVGDFVLSHRHLFLIEENTYYMLSNQHESKNSQWVGFRGSGSVAWLDSSGVDPAGNSSGAAAYSCVSIPPGGGANGNSGEEGRRIWAGVSGWSVGEKERDIFARPSWRRVKMRECSEILGGLSNFYSTKADRSLARWCMEEKCRNLILLTVFFLPTRDVL
jgi:hypothetical protein